MQYTENHNFKLPDGTDRFNIQNENDNWESLDTLLEDYLPLTAGSTKPLSSPLYLENTYGKARLTIGSAGGVTLAARNEADDTSTVGFHSFISDNKGYAIVFGDGGEIRLRPNGITTTTGQVCIDTTGQQIGGHPVTTLSGGTKTLTASGYTAIGNMSNIPSGVYTVFAKANFLPSNSNAGKYILQLGPTTDANWVWHTHDITPGSVGHCTFSAPMSITTGKLYFVIWSGIAAQTSSWEMGYQRWS